MMMDTSPVHRIWHAKAIYSREMTQLAAQAIHIPPLRHTELSLADWTRPSFVSRVKTMLALSSYSKKSVIEQQKFTHTKKYNYTRTCTLL
jgi:hypothetical protein